MFLLGVGQTLGLESTEGADHAETGGARLDHVVDVAELGCFVRVGELLAIVKVDAMAEEFAGPDGRKKLREDYLATGEAGAPWIIPAEQFDVQEVRPLSLSDLAISDMVQLDKRTVASIVGVPPFLLGVGEYNQNAWNNFVMNKVRTICVSIQQELTKKLIISPKMYLRFNYRSLLDWDLKTIFDVYGGLSDKGIITGNEVRDAVGMTPMDGLDELSVLENYIPREKIGDQNKLSGGE